MKIAILNTFDSGGGAARSAYRLHQGLVKKGVTSRFVAQYNQQRNPDIVCGKTRRDKLVALLRPLVDMIPMKIYGRRDMRQPFSTAYLPVASRVKDVVAQSDVLHLHWIVHGFINIQFLREASRPIVWTMHDSWTFTGGCHLPADCRRYQQSCGRCPQLASGREKDLTRLNWNRKQRAWEDLNIIYVAPSNWMAERARSSSLLTGGRVEVIPNGIDTNVFKPADRDMCRRMMNLPADRHLILFGAMGAVTDENKGFLLLRQALAALPRKVAGKDCMLVVFGAQQLELPDLDIEVRFIGTLTDDIALSVLYCAADVMVVPSKQENLPNTIMESMACGTPVVAFRIGGIPDLIEHCQTGYMAEGFDTADLALGIKWTLEQSGADCSLGKNAREKVEREFAIDVVSARYMSLYVELVEKADDRK
jgi:glycosyltransferase involved in cell wall biosynthesis